MVLGVHYSFTYILQESVLPRGPQRVDCLCVCMCVCVSIDEDLTVWTVCVCVCVCVCVY